MMSSPVPMIEDDGFKNSIGISGTSFAQFLGVIYVISTHTDNFAGNHWGQQLNGIERCFHFQPAVITKQIAVNGADIFFV